METRSNYVMVGAVTAALLVSLLAFIVWLAGLSNNPNGFVGEDAFVESIWGSLEAHGG